jgi:hypothetical protein
MMLENARFPPVEIKTLWKQVTKNQRRTIHSTTAGSQVRETTPMKRLIALTVLALASQAVGTFAGEPVVSSKQVVAPPPPPPVSFFRGNEFDIGAFANPLYNSGFRVLPSSLTAAVAIIAGAAQRITPGAFHPRGFVAGYAY